MQDMWFCMEVIQYGDGPLSVKVMRKVRANDPASRQEHPEKENVK
jgi:hypothetical protein